MLYDYLFDRKCKRDYYLKLLSRFLYCHGGYYMGRATDLCNLIRAAQPKLMRGYPMLRLHPNGLGHAIAYYLPTLFDRFRMRPPTEYQGRTMYRFFGLTEPLQKWRSKKLRKDCIDITNIGSQNRPPLSPSILRIA